MYNVQNYFGRSWDNSIVPILSDDNCEWQAVISCHQLSAVSCPQLSLAVFSCQLSSIVPVL